MPFLDNNLIPVRKIIKNGRQVLEITLSVVPYKRKQIIFYGKNLKITKNNIFNNVYYSNTVDVLSWLQGPGKNVTQSFIFSNVSTQIGVLISENLFL